MSKTKRVPNPPRRCIFCDGGQISKEHIFAKWIQDYTSDEYYDTTNHTISRKIRFIGSDDEHDLEPPKDGFLKQKGSHKERGIRSVCKTCNNTWMSDIQKDVIPVLGPLFENNHQNISAADCEKIALWATMFAMVFESSDPEWAATPQAAREEFMRDRQPLSNWSIWLGKFRGRDRDYASFHRGIKFINLDESDNQRSTPPQGQITICAAGNCIFFIFSCNDESLFQACRQEFTIQMPRLGMKSILPSESVFINPAERGRFVFDDRSFVEFMSLGTGYVCDVFESMGSRASP